MTTTEINFIRFFNTLSLNDVPVVGGKNASLGEMTYAFCRKNIQVPNGFATTVDAYRHFLEYNHLSEKIQLLIGEFKAVHAHHPQARQIDPQPLSRYQFSEDLSGPRCRIYRIEPSL
jgi:pyruvate,water dikinase